MASLTNMVRDNIRRVSIEPLNNILRSMKKLVNDAYVKGQCINKLILTSDLPDNYVTQYLMAVAECERAEQNKKYLQQMAHDTIGKGRYWRSDPILLIEEEALKQFRDIVLEEEYPQYWQTLTAIEEIKQEIEDAITLSNTVAQATSRVHDILLIYEIRFPELKVPIAKLKKSLQ